MRLISVLHYVVPVFAGEPSLLIQLLCRDCKMILESNGAVLRDEKFGVVFSIRTLHVFRFFHVFFKGIFMILNIKAFILLLAGNDLLPVCEATAEGNSWTQRPVHRGLTL